MSTSLCRSCGAPLVHLFCDLGLSPVSNAFIKPEDAHRSEVFHPLRVRVCDRCWLVQLDASPDREVHFHDDYVYYSSFSESWLLHARRYVEAVTARFGLGRESAVMEIGSNDGYLLQYLVEAGVPCLGVEPSANTAAAAREKGVETRTCFFGRDTAASLAREGWRVDLLIANNVLAHVPDLHDFVGAMPLVLKPRGVVTLEFPHLLCLMRENQFDTIYHEHYTYLSLTALLPVFRRAGLRVFDVERLATHGGSLRLYLCLEEADFECLPAVEAVLSEEREGGLTRLETYLAFGERVRAVKRSLLAFLIDAKERGKRIAAYGAAAKGNTLLNYCGVGVDFIDYVADRNPLKQGRLLPGTRIPVVAPEQVYRTRPDYLLVLPWNIKEEIMHRMSGIRVWGGRFVIPIPEVEVRP